MIYFRDCLRVQTELLWSQISIQPVHCLHQFSDTPLLRLSQNVLWSKTSSPNRSLPPIVILQPFDPLAWIQPTRWRQFQLGILLQRQASSPQQLHREVKAQLLLCRQFFDRQRWANPFLSVLRSQIALYPLQQVRLRAQHLPIPPTVSIQLPRLALLYTEYWHSMYALMFGILST